MLLVIGRVRCERERRDELIGLFVGMQDESRREDGCIR
jgi:quinol monooxygenase YgiN